MASSPETGTFFKSLCIIMACRNDSIDYNNDKCSLCFPIFKDHLFVLQDMGNNSDSNNRYNLLDRDSENFQISRYKKLVSKVIICFYIFLIKRSFLIEKAFPRLRPMP